MAENKRYNWSNVVCRFFAGSGCRDGSNCLFPHNVDEHRVPDNVCRYFLEGRCLFGDVCRYDHVEIPGRTVPSDIESATNLSCKVTSNGKVLISPKKQPSPVKSYADALKFGNADVSEVPSSVESVCVIFENFNICPDGDQCPEIHGEKCEICGKFSLHPSNEDQRQKHNEQCEKEMLENMEHSFAIQRSMDKTCGICMDIVLEKDMISDQRFGILENCNHVYCLKCIRTWRKTKPEIVEINPAPNINRACPQCRRTSDFVIPSNVWIEDEDEKAKLSQTYKDAMAKKHCKFFKQGSGICPFGGSCFYLHAMPDGTKVDLPILPPRRYFDQSEEARMMEQPPILWNFMEIRDEASFAGLSIWANFYPASNDEEGW